MQAFPRLSRRSLANLAIAITASAFGRYAKAAEPIRIGAIVALSPPGSVTQGSIIRDSLTLTVAYVNQQGGVLGRPVELLIEDHQGIPERARAAAEKLITLNGVAAIVGEHQSSTALAAAAVVHAHGIPYVNANASADSIRLLGYREVFNVADSNSRVAEATAAALVDLKVKTVVAFPENDDFGTGLAKSLGAALKEKGPGIDYRYEVIDRTSKDFTPLILPLQANPPDAIVQIAVPPAGYILLEQLYQQGVAPSRSTWVFDETGSAGFPDFWRNVGDAGRGLIDISQYHPKMHLPPLGVTLAQLYTAKTGNDPNRLVFLGADSLLVVLEAIRQAGTTDPAKIIPTLAAIEWTGTRGTITFDRTLHSYKFQQWLNAPQVTFQYTAVGQSIGQTQIAQITGSPLDVSKLVRL